MIGQVFLDLVTVPRFKNFSNVFCIFVTPLKTFEMRFKNKRVLNINVFETFETRFKYYKRVLNISNVFETFKTRLKHFKRVLNIINVF